MARYDVVVAGGGAAGLSAAIFLARAGISVAVFDRAESSLRRVEKVYNYLGFPDGIGGTELLVLGRRQAERFGAAVLDASIDKVAPAADGFTVAASDATHECAFFILASNKRTDLATALGIELGGFGGRFVQTDENGATVVDHCYAVGRITGHPSQAIVSAGDGARVAIAIIERIRGGYYVDHDT